ncbi:MAG: tRNA (adenosine(37)-N6)-threonylcarbamoyltransferase complex ATPase subunit type 1 TsaE [Chlamydiia bacterium]|nr:tRNA (adenosine(37)-N6)-threonylcarbamoyltransferase complex ATPase subunit type 1 TsaE [Chlamydiia bacterium]
MSGNSETKKWVSSSLDETVKIAKTLFQALPKTAVLCFYGELGAGKTSFIKGLAEANGIPPESVTSPTFTYLNLYKGKTPFAHFDLWRLEKESDFIHQGFEEFLDGPGLICIEWPERIPSLIPKDALKIYIKALDENTREIQVS